MYGKIPDARTAYFDIWRNYEEIRISDVSYLLKLNHSRLLISYLKWRPELKQDLKVHTGCSKALRPNKSHTYYLAFHKTPLNPAQLNRVYLFTYLINQNLFL